MEEAAAIQTDTEAYKKNKVEQLNKRGWTIQDLHPRDRLLFPSRISR
jgi:hypothetical protein